MTKEQIEKFKKQVRNSGTMNGFNYAYCKVLLHETWNLLKTDILDESKKPFEVNNGTMYELIERLKEKEDKKTFYLKADSLLNHVLKELEKQVDTEKHSLAILNSEVNLNHLSVKSFQLYLKKVKTTIAIFE